MKDGFIKVAVGLPQNKVADIKTNCQNIIKIIDKAAEKSVNLLVFPELSIPAYTCGDLFFNDSIVNASKDALLDIATSSKGKYPVIIVGAPLNFNNKLYNCAVVIKDGAILGVVPKYFIANFNEFSEGRYFESGKNIPDNATFKIGDFDNIPFSFKQIFVCKEMENYSFGIEICEDFFAPAPKNTDLCLNGANIIANLSASNDVVGKADYRRDLINVTSKRLNCGYVFANASLGESTTDLVFSGNSVIAENGSILAENKAFDNSDLLISEIDVNSLKTERSKNTSFTVKNDFRKVDFSQEVRETVITRSVSPCPFDLSKTALKAVLDITANALRKRIEHTNSKKCVIGISGGLDSTLALFITAYALKLLNRPLTDILAVTMPCFGTTKRTRSNSEILCNALGTDFKEINITDSVKQHFLDIGQNENIYDVTFENSQARERTQVIMDIANKENGIVIGTGDLSELALGWATYNGDHMSMYAVNAGIPKTLIRHILAYIAENSDEKIKNVLNDILDTPVSPELIPATDKGEISQKTEDLVGPYELHDFFIYYTLRYGFSMSKIFRLSLIAFSEKYSKDVIKKWLTTFARRFITQQFKRSCLPDGPKVLDISVSPRGDLKLPSDATFNLLIEEIEKL